MVSLLAIINAKRVWRGGPVTGVPSRSSSHPTSADAVLVKDGLVDFIGSTAEVLRRFAAQRASTPADPHASAAAVYAGRPRLPHARVIDCCGTRSVYPGFIDSHVHFLDGGRSLLALQLATADSRVAFIARLREYAETVYDAAASEWIFGGGWSEAMLGQWPSREWLDAVSRDIPIMLYSKDVHSCVMNEAALRACHIIPGAPGDGTLLADVPGGRIERDATGAPTGILRDNAIAAAKRYVPRTDSPAAKRAALHAATHYCLSRGFTTVFSMMSTQYADHAADVAFLRQVECDGELRVRVRYGVPVESIPTLLRDFWEPVRASVQAQAREADYFTRPYRFTCLPPQHGGGYFVLGAVKIFGDGSLSSRTAAMNRPYGTDVITDGDVNSELDDAAILSFLRSKVKDGSSSECQCGLLTLSRVELRAAVHAAHAHSLQCCVHAIGDRAVAAVNKVLADSCEALRARGTDDTSADVVAFQRDPRPRVEHCQHVSNVSKETARMAAHGVVASMQPCHLLFDGDYVDELLGPHRKAKSYLWGTFIRSNVAVAFGSDWPVAPADLNDGLRGAVTRVPDAMAAQAAEQRGAGTEDGGSGPGKRYHDVWSEEECISMDAALRAYTHEGAHGAFLEESLGSLETGKFADITIWSDDFLEPAVPMEPLGVAGGSSRWWPRGREPEVLYAIVGGIVEYEKAVATCPSGDAN